MVTVGKAVEPEIVAYEIINGWEMNGGEKPLDMNIMNLTYADKPNLLTDQAYILSDTAMISLDIYTQLISLSHTLGSFVRKVMLIIKYVMMKCKVIDERMKKNGCSDHKANN